MLSLIRALKKSKVKNDEKYPLSKEYSLLTDHRPIAKRILNGEVLGIKIQVSSENGVVTAIDLESSNEISRSNQNLLIVDDNAKTATSFIMVRDFINMTTNYKVGISNNQISIK